MGGDEERGDEEDDVGPEGVGGGQEPGGGEGGGLLVGAGAAEEGLAVVVGGAGFDEGGAVEGEPVGEVVSGDLVAECGEGLDPAGADVGDGEVRLKALGDQPTSA